MPEYIDKKTVLDILNNGGYLKQQLEEIESLPVVETDQKPEKKSARKKKKRLENAVPVTFVSPEAPSSEITVILRMDPGRFMAYLQINDPDVRHVFLMDVLFRIAVGVVLTERGYRRYKERDCELPPFIEVGASCFDHCCASRRTTGTVQTGVLRNVHRRKFGLFHPY